jgi:hypothetical protein
MKYGSRLTLFIGVLAIGFLSGCKKDDPEPLQAEVKATLLAGDAGSSKSWKLVTFAEKRGTAAEGTLTLSGCATDNIYKFSNNASQAYEVTEGSTKCDPADPTISETGTWAFTLDGTMLLLTNKAPNFDAYFQLATFFPYPGEILELSESILKIKMTYTLDGVTIVDTFTFNKN